MDPLPCFDGDTMDRRNRAVKLISPPANWRQLDHVSQKNKETKIDCSPLPPLGVAVLSDYVLPPPRKGSASPVLAMLTTLCVAPRGP